MEKTSDPPSCERKRKSSRNASCATHKLTNWIEIAREPPLATGLPFSPPSRAYLRRDVLANRAHLSERANVPDSFIVYGRSRSAAGAEFLEFVSMPSRQLYIFILRNEIFIIHIIHRNLEYLRYIGV